jgi:membrane-associated phospholipid phosphatase
MGGDAPVKDARLHVSRLASHVSPAVFAFLSLFVGISMLVVSQAILPLDEAIMRWLGPRRSAELIDWMLVASFTADTTPIVIIGIGISVLLWRLAGRRVALALLLGGGIGELFYTFAKWAFHRPRPKILEHLSSAGWHAYPSGHTTLSVIIVGLAFVLLADALPRLRHLFWAIAVLIPIAVAFSRVGLGVHYPSDVLGGLALGWAWVFWWRDWSRRPATSPSADTA